MAAKNYRSAELVFGWSFYRQGTGGDTSSADEFLDAALTWFGDPDPRLGTAWEKGERLAKLVAHRRTLLVLDGLEPLQNPPGPQEGRLREPSLQALLRELAAFNKGLCVITTRTPVADIADHEGSAALSRNLDQLSSDAGAKLLRALGVYNPCVYLWPGAAPVMRTLLSIIGPCAPLALRTHLPLGPLEVDSCRPEQPSFAYGRHSKKAFRMFALSAYRSLINSVEDSIIVQGIIQLGRRICPSAVWTFAGGFTTFRHWQYITSGRSGLNHGWVADDVC
jgi:hypothetical protein